MEPQQLFDWLGVQYNLVNHTAQNTVENHSQFLTQLRDSLKAKTITKRQIMRLQGLANWLGQVNPLARIFLSRTKPLLKRLKRVTLDTKIQMNNRLKALLVKGLQLQIIPQRLGLPMTTCTVLLDASRTGWGFKINQASFQGQFDRSMRVHSINVLELLTIWWATLMIDQRNQIIHICTDNSTAVSAVMNKSSNFDTLAGIAELIWKRAARMNWTITIAHIQGKFNILADQLSRNTTISTEWTIPPAIFRKEIMRIEPRLQVDLFATSLNHQLPTFVSPCPDDKATAVDALLIDWGKWDHIYLFPPTPMISKALQKLIQSNIQTAIMLTREEPSRPWYQLLISKLSQLNILEVKLQQQVGSMLQFETSGSTQGSKFFQIS